MMRTTVEWPDVSAELPNTSDVDLRRLYGYFVDRIADRVGTSRGGKLHVKVYAGPWGLGARVYADPPLARRERQVVRSLAKKLDRFLPVVFTIDEKDVQTAKCAAVPVEAGDASERRQDAKQQSRLSRADDSLLRIKVFDLAVVEQMIEDLKTVPRDSDSRRRLEGTLLQVQRNGAYRIRSSGSDDWAQRVQALRDDFPNFGQVIDFSVRPHLALVRAGAARARMPPILLIGPPGVSGASRPS
jgi:hypothetical protein